MQIKGTSDHIIYLERKGLFDECLNEVDLRKQTLETPLNEMITKKFIYRIFFFIGFLLIALFVYRLLRGK
jgi:hypothetical protein